MSMRNRIGVSIIAAILMALPLAAEEWSGFIGLALTRQEQSGSGDSFATQSDLRSGVSIDALSMTDGSTHLRATGYAAEPAGSVAIEVRPQSPWRFDLHYDTRRSLFASGASDPASRRDDWSIDRWVARGSYDGLRLARVGLTMRRVTRRGDATRPFYGLNEQYLLDLTAHDTTDEATLVFETKTLPARITVEQSLTRSERRDRRSPAADAPITGSDPDVFSGASSTRTDTTVFPTTRVITTWANERVQVAGNATLSPAELDGSGLVSSSFALDGGTRGSIEFIDDAVASADREIFGAGLAIAWRAGSRALLRVDARADGGDRAAEDDALPGQGRHAVLGRTTFFRDRALPVIKELRSTSKIPRPRRSRGLRMPRMCAMPCLLTR